MLVLPYMQIPHTNFSQTSHCFHMRAVSVLLNTVRKEEIALNKQFLLPQCFLPQWRTVCHFHQIQNCRLQTVSLEESKTCRLGKV